MRDNLKGGLFHRGQPKLLEVRKSPPDLHTEYQHQCGVVSWARWAARQLQHAEPLKALALRWLHAVPNGLFLGSDSRVKAILGRKAVAAGLTRGVSDLFLPYPAQGHSGLYVEMKVKGNEPDEDQQEFIRDIRRLGYKCVVCHSFREAAEEIVAYLELQTYPRFE
jgi:hypothetical protein